MADEAGPLLTGRRFGPLFVTQSLSAFNGNLCKTAMLFLLTFGADGSAADRGTTVSVAAAVFVAPFFLFSGRANCPARPAAATKKPTVAVSL